MLAVQARQFGRQRRQRSLLIDRFDLGEGAGEFGTERHQSHQRRPDFERPDQVRMRGIIDEQFSLDGIAGEQPKIVIGEPEPLGRYLGEQRILDRQRQRPSRRLTIRPPRSSRDSDPR